MHLRTKPRQRALPRWQNEQDTKSLVYRTMSYGTSIRRRNLETPSCLETIMCINRSSVREGLSRIMTTETWTNDVVRDETLFSVNHYRSVGVDGHLESCWPLLTWVLVMRYNRKEQKLPVLNAQARALSTWNSVRWCDHAALARWSHRTMAGGFSLLPDIAYPAVV